MHEHKRQKLFQGFVFHNYIIHGARQDRAYDLLLHRQEHEYGVQPVLNSPYPQRHTFVC